MKHLLLCRKAKYIPLATKSITDSYSYKGYKVKYTTKHFLRRTCLLVNANNKSANQMAEAQSIKASGHGEDDLLKGTKAI